MCVNNYKFVDARDAHERNVAAKCAARLLYWSHFQLCGEILYVYSPEAWWSTASRTPDSRCSVDLCRPTCRRLQFARKHINRMDIFNLFSLRFTPRSKWMRCNLDVFVFLFLVLHIFACLSPTELTNGIHNVSLDEQINWSVCSAQKIKMVMPSLFISIVISHVDGDALHCSLLSSTADTTYSSSCREIYGLFAWANLSLRG